MNKINQTGIIICNIYIMGSILAEKILTSFILLVIGIVWLIMHLRYSKREIEAWKKQKIKEM